jgi:hypothetical protein
MFAMGRNEPYTHVRPLKQVARVQPGEQVRQFPVLRFTQATHATC